MNKRTKILYAKTAVILAAIPVLVYAYEFGPNPGYTAAPGDNPTACISSGCHVGTRNSGPGKVKITLPAGNTGTYVPGQAMQILVQITDSTKVAYGFQLTARMGSGNLTQSGDFTTTDANTQVLCADGSIKANGAACSATFPLEYIEHTLIGYEASIAATPRGSYTYSFNWTPPATASGNVTLYVAANAGIGDPPVVTPTNVYTSNITLTEATSAFVPSLYFSQLAFAGGWQTTLTYINYSPQTVTCTTNFYSDTGGALALPFSGGTVSTRTDVLPPGGSIHDQTTASLTAAVTDGFAEASCSGPVQANVLYRLYQTGLPAGAAAVPLGEASLNAESVPASQFVTFAQTNTGVAYANPSATQSASITFKVFNAAGAQLGSSKTITLGPLQHSSSTLGSLLGLSSFVGSVQITSTVPILSLSLNAEAFPVFSALPPGDLSGSPSTAAQTYYFSQLAFAGGWQTTLTYINYSSQTVTCTTNFSSDTGGALALPFSGGTVSTRTDVLPPGGSIHDQTIASLTATTQDGWAQSSCSGPVQANVLYRLYQTGLPAGAAAVPLGEASLNAETVPASKFVTFAQTNTGVAYANPSATQSAVITFAVFNAAGAQLGSKNITLGPLQHSSSTLGSLLGLSSFVGSVQITSTAPILSLSLNAEAFPVFSALPPGDLVGP